MTAPRTHITGEDQQAILDAFADAYAFLRAVQRDAPSRENSLAITNLEQAQMWAFADARAKAGGAP